jgi:plastocyanin
VSATRRLLTVLAVVALAVGAAACSSDNKVGEGLNTDVKGGTNRLGEATTTTAPPVTTAAPATAPKAVVTTAKPPVTAAKAAPAAPALVIKIQQSSPQFDPALGAVRTGQIVRWQNADSQPRSVEADNGAFRSPMIPPGGTFDLKAPAPGSYNYHDGTRPYAVAQLQIS